MVDFVRVFIAGFTFLFVCSFGFSQNYSDSVWESLNDSEKPELILHKISKRNDYSTRNSEINDSLGLAYSKQNNLLYYQCKFLANTTLRYYYKNEFENVLSSAMRLKSLVDNNENCDKRFKKRVLAFLSFGYYGIGDIREAIYYRKRFRNEYWNEENRKMWNMLDACASIGGMYLEIGEYDSSIVYYTRSMHESVETGDSIRVNSSLNNIGLVYLKKREIELAESYFLKSLANFREGTSRTDSAMIGVVSGNLAECYSTVCGNKTKLNLWQTNVDICRQYPYYSSTSYAYMEMAKELVKCNRNELAISKLDSAMIYIPQIENVIRRQKKLFECYESYKGVYKNMEDVSNELKYVKLSYQLQDSLYGEAQTQKLISTITQFKVDQIKADLVIEHSALEKVQFENKILEKEKKLNRDQFVVAIAGFVIVLLVIGIVGVKYRGSQKLKLETAEMSKVHAESLAEINRQNLTKAALVLNRKAEFGKELISRVRGIEGVEVGEKNALKLFIENELGLGNEIKELENQLNKLSAEFFLAIDSIYPGLNDSEKKLCGFIKLGLSNKEIALIRNIEVNSVKQSKNRLRKKLKLPAEVKISDVFSRM